MRTSRERVLSGDAGRREERGKQCKEGGLEFPGLERSTGSNAVQAVHVKTVAAMAVSWARA